MSTKHKPLAESAPKFSRDNELIIAPLWRRLAALVYDSLIVVALWMLATALVLPLNQGQAFASTSWLFRLYLLVVALSFFVGFWRFGGQTLGMKAWRIKLIDANNPPKLGSFRLLVRAVLGLLLGLCAGLNYWWVLFDRDKICVNDRVSYTRIILTPKA